MLLCKCPLRSNLSLSNPGRFTPASPPKLRTCERSSSLASFVAQHDEQLRRQRRNQIDNEPSGRSLPQARPRLAGQALANALMESASGLYKTELIDTHPVMAGCGEVEREIAAYVTWFNAQLLHSSLGYETTTDYETSYRERVTHETELA